MEKFTDDEFDHVKVQGGGDKVDIFVVSDQFKGMLPLARHRMINDMLKEEIKQVHAVQIEAKTVDQLKGR